MKIPKSVNRRITTRRIASPSGWSAEIPAAAGITTAASPEAVSAVLQALEQDALDKLFTAVLALTADRAPTQLVMRQVGERYEITVRGPEPAAKPRR